MPPRKQGGFTADKNVDLLSLSFAPCKGPRGTLFTLTPLDTHINTFFSFFFTPLIFSLLIFAPLLCGGDFLAVEDSEKPSLPRALDELWESR